MFGNLRLITLYILTTTTIAAVVAFDLKCTASKNDLRFSVTNANDSKNIQSIQFKHKTPNPGDPWIAEDGCNFLEGNELVCSNKNRASRPQSFRIDLLFTDKTDESRELWYYDCYQQHGVSVVNVTGAEWNKFTIVWRHFDIDAIFMKEDVINITNTNTGRLVHRQVHNQKNAQVYTYSDADPSTNYTVCVRAKFFGFLKGSAAERDTKDKCVRLTTKEEPSDNRTKEEGTDLKTPLLAVGIGILCLVLLCLLFVIYNKKCKQGGDHDYDMNNKDALMANGGEGANEGGEGVNGGGEEMQVYNDKAGEAGSDKEQV